MTAPVELFRDEFSTYFCDDLRGVIEQRWSTRSMSEQQFRGGISRLAQFLERAPGHNVFVDMSKINHSPSSDFEAWRQSQIIPRYNSAGVKKFAFLLPPGARDIVENGTEPAKEGAANFPTGYFASRDQALKWLES